LIAAIEVSPFHVKKSRSRVAVVGQMNPEGNVAAGRQWKNPSSKFLLQGFVRAHASTKGISLPSVSALPELGSSEASELMPESTGKL
jgi:hypothetical protein